MMMKNFFNGKNKQIVHDIKNSEKRNVVVVVVILIGLDRSVFVWLLWSRSKDIKPPQQQQKD